MKTTSFRQKHPLFSNLITGTLLSYAVPLLLISVSALPVEIVKKFSDNADVIGNIVLSAASLLALFIHRLWFREEFTGCFCRAGLKDKKANIIILLTFSGVFLVSVLPGWIDSGVIVPSAYMLTAAISAGAAEETIFRAFPVSVFMRRKKSKKLIILTLVFTSVVFGMTHLSNLKAGATVQGVIVQVISSSFCGFFLCAVYLRTGNILLTMLYHGIYDYLCFMTVSMSTGIVGNLGFKDIALECAAMIIEVIATVVLLRGNTDNIINRWNGIWKLPSPEKSD